MVNLLPPKPRNVIYNSGCKFKLHFAMMYAQFSIKQSTTVNSPQGNAIIKCLLGVLGNMLHTAMLQGKNDFDLVDMIEFIIDAAWAVCSTHHTVLGSAPGANVL